MTEPSPSCSSSASSSSTATAVVDLDDDSLARCASYLSLQDVSNMALASKLFNRVAYSDSVWHRLFRQRWPGQMEQGFHQLSSMREAYLDRLSAIQKFNFVDPLTLDFHMDRRPVSHVLLHKDGIICSKGSLVQVLKIDNFLKGKDYSITLNDHKARVTCMRLFPAYEDFNFSNETQTDQNVLVTSSCDHSIRLWWKGSCYRCFRGHSGPVSVLSDKLLGDDLTRVFASGGEDGTVRLWSGKKGQHGLKATLHGHEKPIKLMTVAGHKTSLLVTIAKDSKVRVWDSTTSSASRSSCCVGTTSVCGIPVGMKCHDSCLYVAAGSSVQAVDLRTMKKAFTAGKSVREIHSFDILPMKALVCTGMKDRALLWDIRQNQVSEMAADPLGELDGHNGPVTLLHMDAHKVVTGGPLDFYTHIWDVETGSRTNSLNCCDPEGPLDGWLGCRAMAVDKGRIVTASLCEEGGLVRYRDFADASCLVSCYEDELGAKFWNASADAYNDSDC